MATSTLGTNANNSIPVALAFAATDLPADIAAIHQAIKDDINPAHPINFPMGGFSQMGQLFIPNRGWLKVLPGDWVGVDNRGWPILLSADTVANGLWTHVP